MILEDFTLQIDEFSIEKLAAADRFKTFSKDFYWFTTQLKSAQWDKRPREGYKNSKNGLLAMFLAWFGV